MELKKRDRAPGGTGGEGKRISEENFKRMNAWRDWMGFRSSLCVFFFGTFFSLLNFRIRVRVNV